MDQCDVTPSAPPRSSSEDGGTRGGTAGAELWRDVLQQPETGEPAAPCRGATPTTALTSDSRRPATELHAVDGATRGGPWLETLLRTLTYAAAVAGLPLVGAAVYADYRADDLLLAGLWVLLYLPLLLPLVWARMPFGPHAAVLLSFLSGVGLLSFFQPGYQGVATPVLLCLPAFATVLLGPGVGRWVLAGAFVGAGAGGWIASGGTLALVGALEDVILFPVWWGSPAAVLLLGGGLVLAGARLRERLAHLAAEGRRLSETATNLESSVEEQEKALARRKSYGEAVEELARLASTGGDSHTVAQRALEIISRSGSYYAAQIFLHKGDSELDWGGPSRRLRLQQSVGPTGLAGQEVEQEKAAADGVVAWVSERRKPYVLHDVEGDQRFVPQPHLPETRAEAAFPLVVGSHLIGVLDVHASQPRAFGDDDLAFLRAAADMIAVALDHQRLTAVPSAAAEALSRAGGRLCGAARKADVVDAIVETVAETGAGSCLVAEFVRGPAAELESLLCLRSWRRQGGGQLRPGTLLPVSSAVFPVDLLEGTWVVPDVVSDERLPTRARALFGRMGVRALVAFPLRGKRETHGQVLVLYGRPGPFSDSEIRLYEVLENQAGLALERALRLDEAYSRVEKAELSTRAGAQLHESLHIEDVLSTAVADIAKTLDLAALDVRLGPPSSLAAGAEGLAGPESETRRRDGE